jgi:hypothetical protein
MRRYPVPSLNATWRKSSASGEQACVEVRYLTGAADRADGATGHIEVRDSKDRDGAVLSFSPTRWAAFTASLRG